MLYSDKLISFVILGSFLFTAVGQNYLFALRPPNGIRQIKKDNPESLKQFEVDGEGAEKVLDFLLQNNVWVSIPDIANSVGVVSWTVSLVLKDLAEYLNTGRAKEVAYDNKDYSRKLYKLKVEYKQILMESLDRYRSYPEGKLSREEIRKNLSELNIPSPTFAKTLLKIGQIVLEKSEFIRKDLIVELEVTNAFLQSVINILESKEIILSRGGKNKKWYRLNPKEPGLPNLINAKPELQKYKENIGIESIDLTNYQLTEEDIENLPIKGPGYWVVLKEIADFAGDKFLIKEVAKNLSEGIISPTLNDLLERKILIVVNYQGRNKVFILNPGIPEIKSKLRNRLKEYSGENIPHIEVLKNLTNLEVSAKLQANILAIIANTNGEPFSAKDIIFFVGENHRQSVFRVIRELNKTGIIVLKGVDSTGKGAVYVLNPHQELTGISEKILELLEKKEIKPETSLVYKPKPVIKLYSFEEIKNFWQASREGTIGKMPENIWSEGSNRILGLILLSEIISRPVSEFKKTDFTGNGLGSLLKFYKGSLSKIIEEFSGICTELGSGLEKETYPQIKDILNRNVREISEKIKEEALIENNRQEANKKEEITKKIEKIVADTNDPEWGLFLEQNPWILMEEFKWKNIQHRQLVVERFVRRFLPKVYQELLEQYNRNEVTFEETETFAKKNKVVYPNTETLEKYGLKGIVYHYQGKIYRMYLNIFGDKDPLLQAKPWLVLSHLPKNFWLTSSEINQLENNLLLIEKMDSFIDYLPQLISIFVLVQKSGSIALSEYKKMAQKDLAALQKVGLIKIVNERIFITKEAISLILNWEADLFFKRLNPTEQDKLIYLVQYLGQKKWLKEQLQRYLGLQDARKFSSFLGKRIFSEKRKLEYKIRNQELLYRIFYENIKGTPKEIKAMINKIQELTYSELWFLFYIYLGSKNYDLNIIKGKIGNRARGRTMRRLMEIGLIHEGRYNPPAPLNRYIHWLSSFPGKTPDEKLKSFREKHPLINTSATTSNEKTVLENKKTLIEKMFFANKELIDDLINLKTLAGGDALNLSSIAHLFVRGLITAEAGKIAISPLGRNILGEAEAKAPIVTKYPFPVKEELEPELKNLVGYEKELTETTGRFFKNHYKNETVTKNGTTVKESSNNKDIKKENKTDVENRINEAKELLLSKETVKGKNRKELAQINIREDFTDKIQLLPEDREYIRKALEKIVEECNQMHDEGLEMIRIVWAISKPGSRVKYKEAELREELSKLQSSGFIVEEVLKQVMDVARVSERAKSKTVKIFYLWLSETQKIKSEKIVTLNKILKLSPLDYGITPGILLPEKLESKIVGIFKQIPQGTYSEEVLKRGLLIFISKLSKEQQEVVLNLLEKIIQEIRPNRAKTVFYSSSELLSLLLILFAVVSSVRSFLFPKITGIERKLWINEENKELEKLESAKTVWQAI